MKVREKLQIAIPKRFDIRYNKRIDINWELG